MLLPEDLIFVDEGISGRNTKTRTAFNTMIGLAKSKEKPFDVILVWKYSRFARNREDSVVYKSMLRKELNIDVISISEDVGDDKMAILFEAMIEAMDEYYSIESTFCKRCGIKKRHCLDGCSEWKQWWIKNWNTNICVKPVTEEPPKREKFKYEHPDLVREGITWTGS